MKASIVFLIAFLICGVLGFMHGRSEAQNPAQARLSLFCKSELCRLDSKGKASAVFLYRIHKVPAFKYDASSHYLTRLDGADIASINQGLSPALKFPIDGKLVLALIGGSTAGYTLKDAVKVEKKSNLVAAVLGAVSGYWLGYRIGCTHELSPESPDALELLESENQWRQFELDYIQCFACRIFDVAKMLPDGVLRGKYEQKALSLMRWAKETSYEREHSVESAGMSSDHILSTADTYNELCEVIRGPDGKGPSMDPAPWWMSWWFVLSGVAVAAAVLTMTGNFVEKRWPARKSPEPVAELRGQSPVRSTPEETGRYGEE